jgi:hypothetical protein
MRIHLSTACLLLGLLAGAAGCGSYSSPNDSPGSADSTADSTPMGPNYLR